MKKVISIILLSVMIIAMCSGCAEPPVEVSREPIDVRYTEAYESIETDYQHQYSWLKGEFVLVPNVKTVRHEAKWEIQYRITYDNGTEETEWCKCTEVEYNKVKSELTAGERREGE